MKKPIRDQVRRMMCLIFTLLCLVVTFLLHGGESLDFPAAEYITQHFKETGSGNLVAAVYLNYRVYDTLFETLLLLVTVLCISFFVKKGGTR